jgi:hypothetical protein
VKTSLTRNPSRMRRRTTLEEQFVEFALRWARHGGGDEYIFPEFGVRPAVFYRRLLGLVKAEHSPGLSESQREFLTAVSLKKLAAVRELRSWSEVVE